MAQEVSGPSASPQSLLNTVQNRRPDAGEEAAAERPEARQRQETTARPADEPRPREENVRTSTPEEQVLLRRETQDTPGQARNESSGRNEEPPVSNNERSESERGAARQIVELERDNARGVRGFEEAANEPQDASRRERQVREESRDSVQSARLEREPAPRAETRAPENDGAQQRLREFETREQERIEPQQVNETVREEQNRAAERAADKEPALETQTVVQAGPTGLEPQTPKEETVSAGEGSIDDGAETQAPESAQTERGQNIDDLI